MVGSYQLVTLCFTTAQTVHRSVYPSVGLFLYDFSTGELIPAENMPVQLTPGFLKQGDRDKFGDTAVLHGKIAGHVIPGPVEQALGSSLTPLTNTEENCYRVINDPSTLKTRIYGKGSTSYSLVTWRGYNHPIQNGYVDLTLPVTTFTFTQARKGGLTILKWHFAEFNYETTITVWVTGDLYHQSLGPSDKAPHLFEGSWEKKAWYRSTGRTLVYTGNTTNLAIHPHSPPTDLAGISSEIVLNGQGEFGAGRVRHDLLGLNELPAHNTQWKACVYAVESMKYLDLNWLELVRDAVEWKHLKLPIQKLARGNKLKALAQVFLWWTYGIKPTIQDALEITEGTVGNRKILLEVAKNFAANHVQYGTAYDDPQGFDGLIVSSKANCRIKLRTRIRPEGGLNSLILLLSSLDIGINATNLLDVIPYSFMVNWFVNVREFTRWIDYKYYPSYYDIDQCVLSTKRECMVPADRYLLNAKGLCQLSMYSRQVQDRLPKEPFELKFTLPTTHLLEGSALIIAHR